MDDKYLKVADKLIKFILSSNQAPYFREYTNIQNGKSFGNLMIEDLGDTMPFLFWAGQNLDFKYSEIADNASKFFIKKFQQNDGFFTTEPKFGFIYNFDKMTDISLGLNLMYLLTNNHVHLDASKKLFDAIGKFTDGFIPYLYFVSLRFGLNFSSGKFGLYIEELCNLYNFTGDRKYLKIAKNISLFWINNKYFKENGLFPFVVKSKFIKDLVNILFRKKFGFNIDSAMSSKANTNLVYGLNALYKITKDMEIYTALQKWHSGVRSKFLCEDGSLFCLYDKKSSHKFLGCDHAVADCFLELYISTKEKKFLEDAEKIANFWIKKQNRSGLVQQGVEGYKVCADPNMEYGNNPQYFRLDPQVDFFVVLIKLYKLTKKKIYYVKSLKLLNGICKYHNFNSGFVNILDENKNKLSYIIETKFLFLVLKALMFGNYKDRIYKDSTIRLLMRDR